MLLGTLRLSCGRAHWQYGALLMMQAPIEGPCVARVVHAARVPCMALALKCIMVKTILMCAQRPQLTNPP